MTAPRTLFDKLLAAHEILRREDGASLLWVDRHLVHEGSHHAFRTIGERGLAVAHPELTFAVMDHYAFSRTPDVPDPKIAGMMRTLREHAGRHGIALCPLPMKDRLLMAYPTRLAFLILAGAVAATILLVQSLIGFPAWIRRAFH